MSVRARVVLGMRVRVVEVGSTDRGRGKSRRRGTKRDIEVGVGAEVGAEGRVGII